MRYRTHRSGAKRAVIPGLLAAGTLAALASARASSPIRIEPMGRGARFEVRPACAVGGRKEPAIFAHPPWKGRVRGRVIGVFHVDLRGTTAPRMVCDIGIADGHGSDKGVIFRLAVDGREIWQEFWKDARWHPVSIDLASWAGRKIDLALMVDTLGEHYAVWGRPRIVDGERIVYDLMQHVGEAAKSIGLWRGDTPPGPIPKRLVALRNKRRKGMLNVKPSMRQIVWQELEFIGFVHFGMNTFTDREWGDGTEDPRLFNPTDFDADQWVKTFREAGIRMLILTAKHHDGFCLWPSRYTEHCVRNSPWRNGKGDVVREVADACRRGGIRFGIYLSPWDRNCPLYGDSPAYNRYFTDQLRELLSNYGPVGEVWFDGACGEGPNGKRQQYDWQAYYKVVRELQPGAVIAICGPDVRWVGNESGVARETEWSIQRPNPAFHGKRDGWVWWPAECDVSIRPGWFYHAAQDDKVKSLEHLLDIYYKSVGRNSVLLLNVPPDRRGRIHENDARRLKELRRILDATFAHDLALGRDAVANSAQPGHPPGACVNGDPAAWWSPAEDAAFPVTLDVDFGAPATFNCIMLQEYIPLGQRVEEFRIEVDERGDGTWREIAKGTTIGYKRLLPLKPDVTARRIRLTIDKALGPPMLRRLGVFHAPMVP